MVGRRASGPLSWSATCRCERAAFSCRSSCRRRNSEPLPTPSIAALSGRDSPYEARRAGAPGSGGAASRGGSRTAPTCWRKPSRRWGSRPTRSAAPTMPCSTPRTQCFWSSGLSGVHTTASGPPLASMSRRGASWMRAIPASQSQTAFPCRQSGSMWLRVAQSPFADSRPSGSVLPNVAQQCTPTRLDAGGGRRSR